MTLEVFYAPREQEWHSKNGHQEIHDDAQGNSSLGEQMFGVPEQLLWQGLRRATGVEITYVVGGGNRVEHPCTERRRALGDWISGAQ